MDIERLSALSLHVFLWTKLTTLTKSFVGSDLPPHPTFKKNSEMECRRSAGHLAKHSLWHFHQLSHHLLHKRILPPSCLVPTCVEAQSQRRLFRSFQRRANADTQSSASVSCQRSNPDTQPSNSVTCLVPICVAMQSQRLLSFCRDRTALSKDVTQPSNSVSCRRHADKLPSNSISCQLPRSPGDQPSTMEPVPGMQDFPLRLLTRFKIVS